MRPTKANNQTAVKARSTLGKGRELATARSHCRTTDSHQVHMDRQEVAHKMPKHYINGKKNHPQWKTKNRRHLLHTEEENNEKASRDVTKP